MTAVVGLARESGAKVAASTTVPACSRSTWENRLASCEAVERSNMANSKHASYETIRIELAKMQSAGVSSLRIAMFS
jgi:hypothetical protein